MTNEFPCTHPTDWPCTDSKIHPGGCGTQETHDAAMGCIDGHYTLNSEGTAEAGTIEMHDPAETHKTGWTGNSEVVKLDADEQQRWRWNDYGDGVEHDEVEATEFWRAAQHRAPKDLQ